MQIHRIRGRNLTEALRRARDAHGDGAVVLSQETVDGGVTIAVAESARARLRRATAGTPVKTRRRDPGLEDVLARLKRHGASGALAKKVALAVGKSGVHGMYALDAAARVLARVFPVQESPKRTGATRVFAFVGPTGAGKTTSLGKLARRLIEADRRVACASLDPLGLGRLEPLIAADEDRLELPLRAIRRGEELVDLCTRDSGVDALLLDTPGISPRDADELHRLAVELTAVRALAAVDAYLVLPATASRRALDLTLESFACMEPAAVVVTKLDETTEPTPALERALRARMPFAFLCDGRDMRAHLHRPRGDHFADLLLRGRIAR